MYERNVKIAVLLIKNGANAYACTWLFERISSLSMTQNTHSYHLHNSLTRISHTTRSNTGTTLQTLAVDYADEELRAMLIREYQLLIEDRIKLKKIVRDAVIIANDAAKAANEFARSAAASNALYTAVAAAEAAKFAKN